MDPRFRALIAFAIDVVAVALFVVIGRASHREDPGGDLTGVGSFATGLVVGWAASRGWRRPFAIAHTGLPVWIGT